MVEASLFTAVIRTATAVAIAASGTLIACTGRIGSLTVSGDASPVTTISHAPLPPTASDGGITDDVWQSPEAIWVQDGKLALLDNGAVYSRSSLGGYQSIAVGAPGERETFGTFRAVASRETGALIATSTGLFVGHQGRLLRSPASAGVSEQEIRFLDVTLSDVGETVWVTGSHAQRMSERSIDEINVADPLEGGAIQIIAGRNADEAWLVQGSSLYHVNLKTQSARVLARGLGTVNGFAKRADGSFVLATSQGLLVVSANGALILQTLTDEGSPPMSIDTVSVSEAGAFLIAGSHLMSLEGDQSTILANIASPNASGLATDAAGNLFWLDGNTVKRREPDAQYSGAALSFETDIKPFLSAHCAVCHATGSDFAPTILFEDYAIAVAWADRMISRIKDVSSPMPPTSKEQLTSSQYGPFIRWASGARRP